MTALLERTGTHPVHLLTSGSDYNQASVSMQCKAAAATVHMPHTESLVAYAQSQWVVWMAGKMS